MQLGSIILAGGRSERMGRPKEALPWGDSTLLLRLTSMLLDCSFPVVIVSGMPEAELPPLHTECDLIEDPEPRGGPLAAIAAGMRYLEPSCEAALVASCDLPFLSHDAVGFMTDKLGEHSGVVPMIDERPQVLCAVYALRELLSIENLLHDGERRASALAELPGIVKVSEAEMLALDPERPFARDIDTPEEYEAALALRRES